MIVRVVVVVVVVVVVHICCKMDCETPPRAVLPRADDGPAADADDGPPLELGPPRCKTIL